jgi:hypothetical protein
MTTHDAHEERSEDTYNRWLRAGLVVLGAIAFFFLWEEHRAHLLGALPWLLLLACPAMHFLMHRHRPQRPQDGDASHQGHDASKESHGGHGCC